MDTHRSSHTIVTQHCTHIRTCTLTWAQDSSWPASLHIHKHSTPTQQMDTNMHRQTHMHNHTHHPTHMYPPTPLPICTHAHTHTHKLELNGWVEFTSNRRNRSQINRTFRPRRPSSAVVLKWYRGGVHMYSNWWCHDRG